jgi:hypothetical protein
MQSIGRSADASRNEKSVMTQRIGTDRARPPLSGAERQRRHRAKVKAAAANQVPLVLSKKMLVRDMKRVAERICDCTEPDVARRIAQEIEECLRARAQKAHAHKHRLLYSEPFLARGLLALDTDPKKLISKDEIIAAYRARVRECHPDTGGHGDPRMLAALKNARDLLLNQ